jgi:hypothetical protein
VISPLGAGRFAGARLREDRDLFLSGQGLFGLPPLGPAPTHRRHLSSRAQERAIGMNVSTWFSRGLGLVSVALALYVASPSWADEGDKGDREAKRAQKRKAKGKETERPSTGAKAAPAKKAAKGKETERPSTGKAPPAKKAAKGKETERPSTGKAPPAKKRKGSEARSSSPRPNTIQVDLNRLPPDLAKRLLRELNKDKKKKGDRSRD